ncbi:hypothetical protein [Marinobacter sp.]|uniref:hypothetical protein n=1 Tax=Marinobacter sp. TaxID=50741 RepID=UPI003564F344
MKILWITLLFSISVSAQATIYKIEQAYGLYGGYVPGQTEPDFTLEATFFADTETETFFGWTVTKDGQAFGQYQGHRPVPYSPYFDEWLGHSFVTLNNGWSLSLYDINVEMVGNQGFFGSLVSGGWYYNILDVYSPEGTGFGSSTRNINVSKVTEPLTLSLLALSLAAIGIRRRLR